MVNTSELSVINKCVPK